MSDTLDGREFDLSLEGDLGYGLGLKPGGIPNFCTSCNILRTNSDLPHFAYLCDSKKKSSLTRHSSDSMLGNSSVSSESIDADEINELVEEQREMFALELKRIFHRRVSDTIEEKSPDKTITRLKEELKRVKEQVEHLQSDLDVYRQLFYGKYKASEILAKQLSKVKQEKSSLEEVIKAECAELQKEVNSLQFALDCTETQLTDSQRHWLERYNSVSHENCELSTTVKEQADTIKTLLGTQMALSHERDELVVLLDIKERLAFQRSSSVSSEDSCSELTSLEMSTLGACSCRGKQQEPCRCARAACSKQRHIIGLSKQIHNLEQQLNEAHCVAEAFQNAFEEQLKKNRNFLKLFYANKLKSGNRSSLLRLLKRQTNTNNCDIIVENLVNLLCDKNEALLHQRLLSKLLAKRLQEITHTSSTQKWNTGSD